MTKITMVLLALAVSMTVFSTNVYADDTTQAPQKEWTFLVYINGHNNLDPYGTTNIKGMEKVGSTDQLNIVVQWASSANNDTRRLLIQKDTSGSQAVTSPVVQSLPRVDMGDYHSLIEFVRWGVQNYPAKHYFIAVWDHGNGWHLQNSVQNMMHNLGNNIFHPSDISWDDNSGNYMTTEQLGVAIGEASKIIGHKVDIYGSDACLMAMAEVVGEMKDNVSVFVGSQEVEPGDGWPYATFLADWAKNPKMSAQNVGATLSKDYAAAYMSGGIYSPSDATLSAFDLAHYDGLINAVKALSVELQGLDGAGMAAVKGTITKTQAFYDDDYKDLYDFVSGVQAANVQVQVGTLADVKKAVESFVVATNNTDNYKNAHGLSIWLPSYSYDYTQYQARYKGLAFDKATGWSNFLAKAQ